MWSNDFIRIPFAEKGRTRKGADCWGLACVIYDEILNIKLPQLLNYKDTHDREHISEIHGIETQTWTDVQLGDEKEFDIIVFKMYGLPTHVGVVIGKGVMVHCERGSGVSVINFMKEYQWNRRIAGIYRHERCNNTNITPSIQERV